MRLFASTLLVVLGLVSHAPGQNLPSWTTQHGAFAFPNLEGTRLLSTAEIGKPEALRTALCAGGQRVAGAVFLVVGAKVSAEATCFLGAEALFDGSTTVPLVRSEEGARCASEGRSGRPG